MSAAPTTAAHASGLAFDDVIPESSAAVAASSAAAPPLTPPPTPAAHVSLRRERSTVLPRDCNAASVSEGTARSGERLSDSTATSRVPGVAAMAKAAGAPTGSPKATRLASTVTLTISGEEIS